MKTQNLMCEHCGSENTRVMQAGVIQCLTCRRWSEEDPAPRAPKARRMRFDDDE